MEQSYKEKYEDILARLAKAKNDNDVCDERFCCVIDDLIPELAESEDERIKHEIKVVLANTDLSRFALEYTFADMITWLEKQGDYANFRDKAQVGDRITKNEDGIFVNLSQLKRVAKPSEKRGEQIDIANKEYWRGYREGKKLILDKYAEIEKPGKQIASYTTIVETGDGGINALVTRELPTDGEQKPTDKVEPKFHEGEWITNGDYIWKIVEVKPLDYTLLSQDDNIVVDTISHVDEQFHSFTIADAKDGDILMANAPFIFNGNLEGGIGCPGAHCAINTLGKFQIPKYPKHWTGHTTTPATKEQRNLLFRKMNEAGYTFDFEKKELKKFEDEEYNGDDYGIDSLYHAQRILEKTLGKVDGYQTDDGILSHKCAITAVKKLYEHKPTNWAEEDENVLKDIKTAVTSYWSEDVEDAILDWLKSLKDRVQPQPKQEWSEEDNDYFDAIIAKLEVTQEDAALTDNQMKFLKALKDRVQPKQEWSEEDSYYRDHIIQIIEEINNAPLKRGENWKAYVNWLKSLRPQNRWKPSELQLECLSDAIEHYNSLGYPATKLKELYEQLKKLKEE